MNANSPDKLYGEDYWRDLLDNSLIIGLSCEKEIFSQLKMMSEDEALYKYQECVQKHIES